MITLKILIIAACLILGSSLYAQWLPDMRLTNDPASSLTSPNNSWSIAANEVIIHVVWEDKRDGTLGEIYYKRSTNGGLSWGSDTRLTNNSEQSHNPSIALSGSDVHVVWYDSRNGVFEIFYKHSSNGGISWGADTRISNGTSRSDLPSIAVSGSFVNVVWRDDRDGHCEVYYKRSTNSGSSWGTDVRLTNDDYNSQHASIAVLGFTVHLVWQDSRFNEEIFYKRSTNGGASWDTDVRLTNHSAYSAYPSVAVSGSNVYVVWSDDRDGNTEIYYKVSTNAGVNWSSDTRGTFNASNSVNPSIAALETGVHVVWRDDRDGNDEIYYRGSTDCGINWTPAVRLTNNSAGSYNSSIALSGSVVHVVWQDIRDGNYEIYYKQNPTGNSIGIKKISHEIPIEYSLSQNYPNPFNPVTIINFSIPDPGTVKLAVFDITGREVSVPVNEFLNVDSYAVDFDASKYPSGIYFYTIFTGSFSETKKMVLVK